MDITVKQRKRKQTNPGAEEAKIEPESKKNRLPGYGAVRRGRNPSGGGAHGAGFLAEKPVSGGARRGNGSVHERRAG